MPGPTCQGRTLQVYPPEVIAELMSWCQENALRHPRWALAVGLPFVLRMTRAQISAARIAPPGPRGPALTHPVGLSGDGEPVTRDLSVPPRWLEGAARVQFAERAAGEPLFPSPRGAGPVRENAPYAWAVHAGVAAIGVPVNLRTLRLSGIAMAMANGWHEVVYASGYSFTTALEMSRARYVPFDPRLR